MQLKIRELREEFGYTQKELAQKLNNVQRNISNWENGTSEPDCATIVAIADIFGVSIDELFGRNGDEQNTVDETKLTVYSLVKRLSPSQTEALKNLLISFHK